MFSRAVFRNARELRAVSYIPTSSPAFFAGSRACLHQAIAGAQFKATQPEIPPQEEAEVPEPFSHLPPGSIPEVFPTTIPVARSAVPPTFTSPLELTPAITTLLPDLATQPSHYITAHLHARPYLLTAGDTLRLPFRMPNVQAGDVLRLNRASNIGSRDFTLKGAPYLDERLFECRVRVLGVEAEPIRIKEKTKRRQRHVRRVKSKHKFTILKVVDVKVKQVDELLAEGAKIVE
ncbi:YmL49 [Arthroderma uncinatum]|uniref:YmL49 n=1 Tax=Arthroderma uncinatum TaxID=74035 RepID=UPI00144AEB3D|nr:YmL49 [Arthroderma uncinatum]KAF3481607.1 YmL49 [Arthroderma uncinatum]